MEKIIGSCGIDCTHCDAYIASKTNDNALRTRTAEKWSKEYHFAFKPEDVNCHGCHATDGVQIGHCSQCQIRSCAYSKSFKTCAECPDFSSCEKLEGFIKVIPGARETLQSLRS